MRPINMGDKVCCVFMRRSIAEEVDSSLWEGIGGTEQVRLTVESLSKM